MTDPIINAYIWGMCRRDRDVTPMFLFAGLNKSLGLTEVYHSEYRNILDSANTQEEQDRIHAALEIPSINQHVKHYLTSGSVEINNALWEHHRNGTKVPEHILRHVNGIESILHKHIINIPGVKLYTGIPHSPVNMVGVNWTPHREKKLIRLPAFTSSTTDFDTAVRFTNEDGKTIHHESEHHGVVKPNARHILELNFGAGIVSAASVKKHAPSDEHEILLGRGHEFFLHPRPIQIENSGYTSPIYLWKTTPGAVARGADLSK
jgi:hypothetical protein